MTLGGCLYPGKLMTSAVVSRVTQTWWEIQMFCRDFPRAGLAVKMILLVSVMLKKCKDRRKDRRKK
jgi:hypothetical protein